MRLLQAILAKLLRVRPYEVELLRPARRIAPLPWLLFVCGVVALTGAVLACRPGWTRQEELAHRRTSVEAELARLGANPATPRRAGARDGERSDLVEAKTITTELRRPWHELFDQIEAAQESERPGVHVVQLNVEPRFATLQLVAEGRDLENLVRFSQRLSGSAGPIQNMRMTHHEWRDTLGVHVVSASMQGELSGTAAPSAGATP